MLDQQGNAKKTAIPNIPLWQALLPVALLISLLFYNVSFAFGDEALGGSNQFLLLIGASFAAVIGFANHVSYQQMIDAVSKNIQATTSSILILLLVGSLTGTWLISGIIPSMIYYGLQVLHPSFFLASSVIICAIISVATGSSWTTTATVGIALTGISATLGIPSAMTAGAVISGAYFGDKMSPMSDTTNLAPAIAGSSLFVHIRYMLYTTVPTITITLIVFLFLGFSIDTKGVPLIQEQLHAISGSFRISPYLFAVPLLMLLLILKKKPPLVALLFGILGGGITAILAQPEIIIRIAEQEELSFNAAYIGVMKAIISNTTVETSSKEMNALFTSGGMAGMLQTIWLIITAMVFGGVMEAIGALDKISSTLLQWFHSAFGIFASTVGSCLAINITASDQYLAILIPGKMYAKPFAEKGLAPENLSRTLEDSGTVTSVLIPWNTCGAYQSGVLGVPVADYFIYAIFNWLSPITTLFFAALQLKLKFIEKTEDTNTKELV